MGNPIIELTKPTAWLDWLTMPAAGAVSFPGQTEGDLSSLYIHVPATELGRVKSGALSSSVCMMMLLVLQSAFSKGVDFGAV